MIGLLEMPRVRRCLHAVPGRGWCAIRSAQAVGAKDAPAKTTGGVGDEDAVVVVSVVPGLGEGDFTKNVDAGVRPAGLDMMAERHGPTACPGQALSRVCGVIAVPAAVSALSAATE